MYERVFIGRILSMKAVRGISRALSVNGVENLAVVIIGKENGEEFYVER